MPKINWKEFTEIKHYVSQARVILCSTWLRLEKLKLKTKYIKDSIKRLRNLDMRLEAFEAYLVSIILKHSADNNGG